LKVSSSHRGFETTDGRPFFWLGDTGWLLFVKLTREEALHYLDMRKKQGYNIIQVMLLHDLKHAVNRYGDSALINANVSRPATTPGSGFDDKNAYDFWDHADFIIDEAAKRGLYMALVPVWGSNVKEGWVTPEEARIYAEFLAARYRDKTNIVWLNGGDIKGTDGLAVWNMIGTTLDQKDPDHLITFHPRGRFTSSRWFHHASWLDFHMFQSGHKSYAQDTSKGETHYGEDNWRYILEDLAKRPLKPTLDGEPSYEGIPYGLHDTILPYWTAKDVRRYAYWSVLAGGAGFTYGHNSVMQFYQPRDTNPSFGAKRYWNEALYDSGAAEMQYLRLLMESVAVANWKESQSMVLNNGERYDRVAAASGSNYGLFYTYTGKNINIQLGKLKARQLSVSWFDPKTGRYIDAGTISNKGTHLFDPPGESGEGNDWVLVLKSNDARK